VTDLGQTPAAAAHQTLLCTRSSDGVVGHIFRTVGEYGYFADRFNAFTVTFRDPNSPDVVGVDINPHARPSLR
jgi:hypothetical protein